MTTLAAVLVRQRDLPLETVEQAMLRQSLFGGDLATNLLELGSIDEPTLLAATAATLDVTPLAAGRIRQPDAELLRSFRATQLLEHPFLPIAETATELIVAVAAPLPTATALDLKQQFGKPLTLRAALEIRIRQAIVDTLGEQLDERTTKLLARLDGAPPEAATRPDLPKPPLEYRASRPNLAATRRSLLPRRGEASKSQGQPRRLGPFTAAMVEIELASAQSPGDVIAAWLDFAAQYFEYTAVFTVQGDIAAGKIARGSGTIGEAFSRIGVPLDMPSALQRARASATWQLTTLEPRGLDRTLARDLGRTIGRQVLLVPIRIRDRVVLLTYGDHGEDDVLLDRVGDILALQPLVERHLERLVVERKRGGKSVRPPDASVRREGKSASIPPIQDRASALANALVASQPPEGPSIAERSAPSPADPHDGPTLPVPAHALAADANAGAGAYLTFDSPGAAPNLDTGSIDESWDLIQPIISGGSADAEHGTRAPTNRPSPRVRDSLPPESQWPSVSTRSVVPPKLEIVAEPEPSAPETPSTPEPKRAEASAAQEPPAGGAESPSAHVPAPFIMPPPTSVADTGSGVAPELEAKCLELFERFKAGDGSALEQLVQMGDVAVEVLVRELPGPTSNASRAARLAQNTKASECGPVLKALVAFGPVARPYVIARTTDTDPSVRMWAIRLLGELPGHQSAIAVAQRIVLDRDVEVRRAAYTTCRQLLQEPDSAMALRQAFLSTAADHQAVITQRLAALDALADLKDAPSIPALIGLLADPNPGTAAAAQQALMVLARQDFGYDAKSWTSWWNANSARDRVEWVIDALDHRTSAIRQAASEELRLISRLYVGNVDDDSVEARLKVQKKYRDWWASGGRSVASSAGSGPRKH
jgi:hypothetical protein